MINDVNSVAEALLLVRCMALIDVLDSLGQPIVKS